MPIFDNELVNNISDRNYTPNVDRPLGSTAFDEINTLQSLGIPGQFDDSYGGITAEEAMKFKSPNGPMTPNSPFSMVSRSELLANQRYPLYERGLNLENVYGLQQSGLGQLGNGLAKMGAFALGTFGQSFATIPDTVMALKNLDMSELSNPDGYESSIDTWMRNVEDYFPNYVTEYEKSRGLATAIPFTYGSANFWGDKILKNSGFMVGAIGGAIVQDAIIGAATEGIGAIPLVAAQLGKASLWLNKVFSAETKLGRVLGATEKSNLGRLLDLAQDTGASQQRILNINKLAQVAAATKLNNGFRYGMSIYGSARTEAAIESRESYRTIKEQLTEQYKLDNFGEEPTPEAIQQIEEYATDAMNARFGINMALLTVSNAVQFGNVFKSFIGAQKGVTSSTLSNFGNAGKIGLKEGTLNTFEKKLPQTFSGKAWEFVKPKAINVFTEGVYEEGGQFAAQVGVEDYYTRKYKAQGKESWNFVKEAMYSTNKGFSEQFGSSEGIESMVIGAITAAITGPVSSRITGESRKNNERLNSTLNILNQYGMTGVLSNKYEDTSRSVEIAKQMNEAVNSGNIFKFKNLKADMFFGFVNSRIPIGMHDVTIEQLEMLKDLPKEEFEKTFGMDFNSSNQKTVSGYVDSLIQKANNINDISTSINSTFNNPYNRIIDPKTDDELNETRKYAMFENWKTDLANFSYMQQDSDQRILDIQTAISQVNPLLTNDLLTLATSEKGLKELSDVYEQKANALSESLANLSPAERTAKREEIKKLRTLSEKISIALNSKNIDPKLFNELINFELNGQEFSPAIPFGNLRIDETTGLREYAEDLNKLNARKEAAAIKFDDLSSEKGFDKYFAEEEELQKETIDVDYVDISDKHKFTNKNNKEEALEVSREYQIPGFSPAKVRKVGNQFKVTSPTGEVTYYDTREEAKQVADDLNVDFSELTTVKVIALNDDGTIKVEDLAGNIQNINSSLLKGYEKLQTEEEKLAKDKETLDKQQEKLEQNSATVVTINPKEGEFVGSEDQRKDASILYLSTSTPSEDTAGEVKNKLPHIVRARKFLNNFKFFDNRDKYKVILVTPNNAEALGLKGIVQVSYEKNITDAVTEDETNVELGFMAQVFIIQTPEGDFFVNEKGEKLSKVGEENPTILDEVIFETMTSAKPVTEGSYVKVRAGQEEEAERALEAYKIFRAEVFAQKGYTPYSFDISRGIAREIKVNGVREDNNVGVILGDNPEDIIANTEGLIEVVTTGKVQHKGQLMSFPLGTTLIKYGDLLDFVNNKKLTNGQATTVFSLIETISKEMIMQSNMGKPVKINYAYSNFLQNVLYWKSKADTKTPSQIGIDTTNMTFNVGGKSFPLSKISESKQEIMDVLQDAFITVNNNTLKLGPAKKFTEYRADKDGNITKVEWPNYQSYLLSGKNPDGSNRPTDQVPLITHTAAPTQTQASYKQKYSYITDGNVLPYNKVPAKPKPAPAQPAASGGTLIGEYELNAGKVNTYAEFNTGPILFTGTVSSEGNINVTIQTNETITKLSTEPQLVAAVDGNLRALPENIVTIDLDKSTNEDKAKLFVKLRIEGELGKTLETQGTNPAPAVEEPAPVQKDRKTEIKEKLKSIQGRSLGFSSTTAPGTVKFTEDGTKVTFVKSQRDKYGRGNEVFEIVYPDGTTSSLVVDYKQRPSKGFSDEREIVFNAEYSENPKALLDELVVLEKVVQPIAPPEVVAQQDIEKRRKENDSLGKSILQKLGFKNENRLPNGNVKGGQAGWKIRFNIKNPKTGESYYDGKGTTTLLNDDYDKRAETLINFLLSYFGSNEKADSKNLQKHYILEDKDGSKREPFKHLTGGEIGESDFTIYIGSADDVMKFISDIRTNHPEILKLLHAGNKSEDVAIDDIFKGRIEGSKIGFSGYHAPTNLNKVTGSNDFTFNFNQNRVNINYNGSSLSDITIIVEGSNKGYKGVFDENLKKDFPELYKNIRNIVGFQLYGDYLQGSNDEFLKLTGVDKINAKYDAELAALEGKPAEAPYDPSKRKRRGDDGPSKYRMVGVSDEDRMTNAELEIFKAWHAKNAAGIPFEVLEKIIKVNDNEEAWGVFENGVAKFVRGGLKGTEYHEIFEAIWASFLSESEKEAILNEFRNQQGQFTDRESGKIYDYSDPAVTDRMIKE